MLLLTAGISVGTMGIAASKATAAMGENRIPKSGLEMSKPKILTEAVPTVTPESAPVDLHEIEVEQPKKTSGKCIITLFGKEYDVTTPNGQGKNGDLFNCGGDMTSKYSAKYGTNVDKMQQFLVGGAITPTVTTAPVFLTVTPSIEPTRTPTAIPTTTVKPTGAKDESSVRDFEDDDDEREDSENRDRYESRENRNSERREVESEEIDD